MPDHTVVLLHGLGRSPVSFWRMRIMLNEAGFALMAPGYLALRAGHGALSDGLEGKLPENGRIDFVGHSLGGLLALRLMDRLAPERRGRIVQLGAPNLGSETAIKARRLGPLVGPSLEELEPHDEPHTVRPDLLAVAGTAAPEALGRVTGLTGPNDGLVEVESALAVALPENQLILPVTHTLMMMDKRVIEATMDFLTTGALDPARAASGYK